MQLFKRQNWQIMTNEPRKGYRCETFDILLMSALTAKTKDTKTSAL